MLLNPELLFATEGSVVKWCDRRKIDTLDLVEEMKDLTFVKGNSRMNLKLDCFEFPNVKSHVSVSDDFTMSEILPNSEKELRDTLIRQVDPLDYLIGMIVLRKPLAVDQVLNKKPATAKTARSKQSMPKYLPLVTRNQSESRTPYMTPVRELRLKK